MSYDDYWHSTPELFWAYRSAYEIKIDEDVDFNNFKAWLNGLYVFKAFHTVEYNMNRQESAEPTDYFDKPIDWKGEYARQQAEKDKVKKQEALEINMKILLSKWSQKINKDKKGK